MLKSFHSNSKAGELNQAAPISLKYREIRWHDKVSLLRNYSKRVQTVAGSYFKVVKDVTDEHDVANPLLQRALPRLLALLELLLQPVQQAPPEHTSVALLGLCLDEEIPRDSGHIVKWKGNGLDVL